MNGTTTQTNFRLGAILAAVLPVYAYSDYTYIHSYYVRAMRKTIPVIAAQCHLLHRFDARVDELLSQDPLLPVKAATRGGGRVVYASNHRSHTDYLVEPLVLDDNGIRPPVIAAAAQK